MGKSTLLPLVEKVTLKKPYLCAKKECRQVIQAGKEAVKRQIEILGPKGETRQVLTCYVHAGECPPRLEKKIVWVERPHTCHDCRQVIKAGQQAATFAVGRRRKPLYEHFPCCPPPEVEEAVTLDQSQPCAKCHRIIPTGSEAVKTVGTKLDRWENPIDVTAFRHHPSCPERGRHIRYDKRGEMSF